MVNYSLPREESAWYSCRTLGTGHVVKYTPLYFSWVSPKFPYIV